MCRYIHFSFRFIYIILYSSDKFGGVLIIIFGLLFLVASVSLIIKELKQLWFTHKAIKSGTPLMGTIVNYVADTSTKLNNKPFIYVVIEFQPDFNTEKITLTFSTGTTKPSKRPIGSTTYIYEYEGQYAWSKQVY